MSVSYQRRSVYLVLVAMVWWGLSARAQDRISETVHNLSISGPGEVRAQEEVQVCIFCHAPHNTAGTAPLWNRDLPVGSYTIYQSSTLDAQPGQPTGSSKLCLSCHDGTIALGSVLSRADRIRMVGGDFMPAGLTNLGTDLSDDHPISFHYTPSLAASDQQLASPEGLPSEVRLDPSGQLQCTTCHSPHHNTHGQFLVISNEFGALCTLCHLMDGWSSGAHQTSGASVSGAQTGDWPYASVAENACRSCHRQHTAGGHQRLLISNIEEDNCLCCHDGQVAQYSIQAELDKLSAHDPRNYLGLHDPVETPASIQTHVECFDCHNGHAAAAQPYGGGGYIPIGATMSKMPGVTIGGALVEEASHEYEVCLRCHGDSAVQIPQRIIRQAHTDNLRLRFSPTNPSFHPVVVSSPSSDTVSLKPGIAHGSLIRCTDCHNNDAGPRAGGSGPDGPHGSIYDFLLERNYTVYDGTPESEFDYAICYKCHERASILSDASFPRHSEHILGQDTPCSACHDPHGISLTVGSGSDHTHLINFDTAIVFPNPGSGVMEFRDLGSFAGSCTLICHGDEHVDESYGGP
jgi:predicted CXXCH cytochrome family protein